MKPREIIADLHNHSTASDGEYSPVELIAMGRDMGFKAIGITDHDSIRGLDEVINSTHQSGIGVIPGVEVTLRFQRPYFVGSLHLLLYFSDYLLKNTDFKKAINHIMSQGRGIALVKDRIEAINREFAPEGKNPLLERPLTVDEITSYGNNITRRHFFLALSEKHKIEDRNQIDKIIGNNSPAYIPSGIDVKLLKPFFDQYSVVKVLAHPAAGSFPGKSHYKEVLPPLEVIEQVLPEFLDPEIVGIDGLEVYYPGHTEQHEQILLDWAQRHDLLITGGSDCHDRYNRPLGTKGVTQQELDKLLEKIG
jgi:predicted metal-dependent phosphoesterase TrpH